MFIFKKIKQFKESILLNTPIRCIHLLEYQSKNLLKTNGIAIQDFCIVDDTEDKTITRFEAKEYVIKAQIHAGGRKKGLFSNGYKGGVQIVQKKDHIKEIINKMLGHRLITNQTPAAGIKVNKVMIAESVNIVRETYVCITMDQQENGPVIIVSPFGGVNIENEADKKSPALKSIPIDIYAGVTDDVANELAEFLQFKGNLRGIAANELKKLWRMFLKYDATQIEINPLAETANGNVISIDAKLNFDDNAFFRQKQIFDSVDSSEIDPREIKAASFNLNYIQLSGNIGCLVNGAGLAMATMDIIKLYGGDPANFLDVGGNVSEDQVKNAFEILTQDEQVEAILVNVFGGIVNCMTIANGIIGAFKSIELKIPLIVRLEGANAGNARTLIVNSGLPIILAVNLDDAVMQVVSCVK